MAVEYYNGTKAIQARFLIDEGIMTAVNIKNLSRRNQINVVRRGCLNTPALIDLKSMPERFRRILEMDYADIINKPAVNFLAEQIIQDSAAIEFYSSYEIEPDRFLPRDVINEYYTNAIVLNGIRTLLNSRTTMRKALGGKTTGLWVNIAKTVLDIDRSKFPHTLPANDRRLKDRYNQYLKDGYECLIHKNFCNKNSGKIVDDRQQAFIIELLADPRNLDNEQVAYMYNMVATKMDWKTIQRSAVAVWRKKFATQIYPGRRGSVAFSNKIAMQVKRSAPTSPLYYWTMDGWDVELLYQKFEDGRTTYHHRPTVVVVLDAMCKYPIGYAIGTHETPELIKSALRNAARHTAELFGTKYRAHQLQSDRYAIKAMTPVYEIMAKHSTPARAKNAKAKIIEPYFNSINKKYCQLMANWSGFGITSDKEKQPNIEYLNKYKSSFPDFEGVCQQVTLLIEREREEKREQMLEAWAQVAEADKLILSTESYLMQFGEKTGKRNMMTGSGLHVTINGVKRDYDSFDLSWRNHEDVRWEVRYDPEDLTQVMAVNEDESLRYLLTEKYVQPMALKDRKPGDSVQLQLVKDHNKQLEKQITDLRAKNIEAITPILEIIPQLDTLGKLLLTDSKGQHKNNRNALRGKSQEPRIKMQNTAVDVETDELDPYKLY